MKSEEQFFVSEQIVALCKTEESADTIAWIAETEKKKQTGGSIQSKLPIKLKNAFGSPWCEMMRKTRSENRSADKQ